MTALLFGPVFSREAVVAPRRTRFYVTRTVYGTALLLLMCTAWMVLTGTQLIRNIGDMASFGAALFQILAPLQLALLLFLAAIQAASAVAVEKDRKTLILLLMTRLSNRELVLGKLAASLLNVFVMLLAAAPIFLLIVAFGGTSFQQVGWTFAVTAVTALAAGSLGTTVALWREKTFQTLALVLLAIVFWIGAWEAVAWIDRPLAGIPAEQWARAASPLHAIAAATDSEVDRRGLGTVAPYLAVASAVAAALAAIGVLRVRRWNPSRDVRPGQEEVGGGSIFQAAEGGEGGESRHASHVDDRRRVVSLASRQVRGNPVLWRETRTWAHGKKILFIRAAYWLMAILVALSIASVLRDSGGPRDLDRSAAFKLLGSFTLLSVVILNALAVTSITNERDGRCLDLLMVTDLTPQEFLFGKLAGVLLISLDLILWPLGLCVALWGWEQLTAELLVYLLIGGGVLYVFSAVLGLHCGMIYWSSRRAITVSLGTLFFLFLGVLTTMVLLVSFTGNMEAQLPPFLAFIVGGAIGLYAAIGARNPSSAMVLASCLLPLAMFYSATSLLLGRHLSVFLVLSGTYGFATAAMIVPALGEFNIAMGRTRMTEDE